MNADFKAYEVAYQKEKGACVTPQVRMVVARKGNGRHDSLSEGMLTRDEGLVGDRWTRVDDPAAQSQITLMEAAVVVAIAGELVATAGDNFLVDFELGEQALPIGTRLSLGDAVVEVTPEPHHGCRKFSSRFSSQALKWVNDKRHQHRRLRGVHAKVVVDGRVKVGDPLSIIEPA